MSIRCTKNHPFFVNNNWVITENLKIGDEITSINFKDKIRFFATNYNCTKKYLVRKKISETNKKNNEILKKNKNYINNFTLVPIEKKHNKFLRPELFKEQMILQSKRMKNNNPMFKDDVRKKVSKTSKENVKSGKTIPFMCKKEYWEKLKVKINKQEQKLLDLLNKYFPNEYEFTGDGKNRIHYYAPDFTNINGKKKVIEYNGCYWHKCQKCFVNSNGRSKRDLDRIKQLKNKGYKVLEIWGHELNNVNDLIEKIGNFTYNGLKIKEIKIINLLKPRKVFNFECEPYNNYFVVGRSKSKEYVLAHNCNFCEDARTNIRWAKPDTIDSEVQDIADLGYKGVYIFDDLFAIAMNKIKPYLSSMSRRDLRFRCNGQARYFTREGEEMAKLLADNGCVEIAFGFESGSQTILDNVQKRTSVEQNYQSVEYAKKHGINVKAFLMLGLPGENRETIAETEKFIRDSGIDDFQLSIYYPYRGTQIRDNLGTQDLHFEGEGLGAYGQKGGSTESTVRTSALSSAELLAERDRLVRTYKPQSHEPKWKDDFFETHRGEKA
jgi:very-short-patch-repair endonuclease